MIPHSPSTGFDNISCTLFLKNVPVALEGYEELSAEEILSAISKISQKPTIAREWSSTIDGHPTKFIEGATLLSGKELGLLCGLVTAQDRFVIGIAIIKGDVDYRSEANAEIISVLRSIKLKAGRQYVGDVSEIDSTARNLNRANSKEGTVSHYSPRAKLSKFLAHLKRGEARAAAECFPPDWVASLGGIEVIVRSIKARHSETPTIGAEITGLFASCKNLDGDASLSDIHIYRVKIQQQPKKLNATSQVTSWFAVVRESHGWHVLEGSHDLKQELEGIAAQFDKPLRFPDMQMLVEDPITGTVVVFEDIKGDWVLVDTSLR